jgi:hypothetical protein
MEFPIQYPGFEGRNLSVRLPGFLSNAKVMLDGKPVEGKKGRHQLLDSQGNTVELRLKPNFFDAVPKVEIAGKAIELAPPLPWHAYVWSGLPLLLVVAGGAIGGACGAVAYFANIRFFRSKEGAAAKFVITGLISVAAMVVYFVVAGAFYFLLGGPGS